LSDNAYAGAGVRYFPERLSRNERAFSQLLYGGAEQSLAERIYVEMATAPEWQHLSFKEMARQAREAAAAFEDTK